MPNLYTRGTCTWRFQDMVWIRTNKCNPNCHCGDEFVPGGGGGLNDAAFAGLVQAKLQAGKSVSVRVFSTPNLAGPSNVVNLSASAFAQQKQLYSKNSKVLIEYPCVTAQQPSPNPTGQG